MNEYTADIRLMGSAFQFIVNAETKESGHGLLQDCIEEVSRIEKLLTEFDDNSETSLINNHAGIHPVQVSTETYLLIQRCIQVSKLTDGCFDITTGILKKLYNFRNVAFELPSERKIQDCLQKTGYRKIKLLTNNRVYLERKGMHIGFGAIGKGYAAHKVMKLMQQKGVPGGVINASGDLCVWGTKHDGSHWSAGIANPDSPDEILLWLRLNGLSIATSGNYEQYFELNGVRYAHNINPVNGRPVTGIKSVSVISPHAELSDALATAVTVLGFSQGLRLINQLPHTHCIIIDDLDQIHFSNNIERDRLFKKTA
ncbi:MAG TPA: FAD:protein FMN transferase [Puia sp.]|nr:FAD:protein FMN transferase [Puia sp.]